MANLRPYQTDIITAARGLMAAGNKNILIQAPTGSGKTLLTAHMLKTAAEKNMSSFFVCHRIELVEQSVAAFTSVGLPVTTVASGYPLKTGNRVHVCNIGSIPARQKYLPEPTLIVWDESHHLAAKSWQNIFYSYPNAFHIGLTATPSRLDGQGLRPFFSHMINGPSVEWLIENKYLSDYKIFAPASPDLTGVRTRMGDYAQSQLAEAMNKPSITGSAINEYKKRCAGKRAIVFAASIEHSENVVAEFNHHKIPAAHIDGGTDKDRRKFLINEFKAGRILILSNVNLFGEGFDVPAAEVAILLRPTQSLALYLQMVGRVLRPDKNKPHAIILDHAGNAMRHGLPDDEREWSLDGLSRDKKTKQETAGVKICPACFGAQKIGGDTCMYCGHVFEKKQREIEIIEGELAEIDTTKIRVKRRQEQGMAQTKEDLVRIGKARGMKNPHAWAHYVFQSRQRKKLGLR